MYETLLFFSLHVFINLYLILWRNKSPVPKHGMPCAYLHFHILGHPIVGTVLSPLKGTERIVRLYLSSWLPNEESGNNKH